MRMRVRSGSIDSNGIICRLVAPDFRGRTYLLAISSSGQAVRTEYRNGESQANRHIAVIGSGIAGLSAAWLLAKRHRVTLYEAEARPGGHSNTVLVPTGETLTAVDT